jgi:hypothetical protein
VIVAFDTGMLSLALHQTARFPLDPTTGVEVEKPRQRIEFLVSQLSREKATIVVPAPAFAEFLAVVEEAGPAYLKQMNRSARFEIASFDTKAAVEAAAILKSFKAGGDKRGGATGDWQRIKVDQQIIAVARSRGASHLYCSDGGIVTMSTRLELPCTPVWRLPLPEEDVQPSLFPKDDEGSESPDEPDN